MASKKSGGGSPRQTSDRVSSIASGILSGKIPNPSKSQMKAVAASALGQDQTKGKRQH